MYKACIVDKKKNEWVFEGIFKGIPVWTPTHKSRPKQCTKVEAYMIASMTAKDGETAQVKLLTEG